MQSFSQLNMKSLVIILCIGATALGWKIHPIPALSKLPPFPSVNSNRIVGGSVAGVNEFPYMVSLQLVQSTGQYHFCGGSILSVNSVLTAAHCLNGRSPSEFAARAGEWNFNVLSNKEQEIQAAEFIIHPGYNPNTNENDIAIVKLAGSFTLNSYVALTNIAPYGYEVADGTTCTVSGWGTLSSGGSSPSTLQKVDMNILNAEKCNEYYVNLPGLITASMVCAAGTGKDACQGDSGGPLYSNGRQVGIVSWGEGCAQYPGVYTKVSYFTHWIYGQ